MKKQLLVFGAYLALLCSPVIAQCDAGEELYIIELNLQSECFDELPNEVFCPPGTCGMDTEMAFISITSDEGDVKHFPHVLDYGGQSLSTCLVPNREYDMILVISESCTEWENFDDQVVENDNDGSSVVLVPVMEPSNVEPFPAHFGMNFMAGRFYKFTAPSSSPPPPPLPPSCFGDLNDDGVVNTLDMLLLMGVFGSSCP